MHYVERYNDDYGDAIIIIIIIIIVMHFFLVLALIVHVYDHICHFVCGKYFGRK